MSRLMLRHANCVDQCPSSRAKRKTCARTEFFSVDLNRSFKSGTPRQAVSPGGLCCGRRTRGAAMDCHKQQFGSPTLRIRKGPGIASGALVLGIGGKCYFLPVLRASFILSPGLNSEAPFDMPVVRESFILSPGANSDAPREFFVAELFICVPGAYP